MLVDILMVSTAAARAEIGQCRGLHVRLQWVHDIYERRCQVGHWTATARAYLLLGNLFLLTGLFSLISFLEDCFLFCFGQAGRPNCSQKEPKSFFVRAFSLANCL